MDLFKRHPGRPRKDEKPSNFDDVNADKTKPIQEEISIEKTEKIDDHIVIKKDFPFRIPSKNMNFKDIERYFKYYMGAGTMHSTLERMVADAREDMVSNHLGTAMKFIGVGILIFLVLLGGLVFINGTGILEKGNGGSGGSQNSPVVANTPPPGQLIPGLFPDTSGGK